MRGDITLKILDGIGNAMIGAVDLIDAFLGAGYGASYGKMDYELRKRRVARNNVDFDHKREAKQKYYNLIYRLKRDGLVEEKAIKGKTFFLLSRKGKNKLQLLKKLNKEKLPSSSYAKEDSVNFTIITFDIPEKERRKRDWLRGAIRNLGFQMIQKSVWIGKKKIPERFLEDLHKLGIVDFVEIFEISKKGTIKHIT